MQIDFCGRIGGGGLACIGNNTPVFITTHGKMSHVLISYDEYRRLTGRLQNALEALSPAAELAAKLEGVELEIPPRSTAQRPPVDFGED